MWEIWEEGKKLNGCGEEARLLTWSMKRSQDCWSRRLISYTDRLCINIHLILAEISSF
jgi:hypothetical protein